MKIQWLGVQGTLSSGISDVDTTISSAGLSDLPEIVAPDYAKIVIDPAGSSGRPEVVYVTAHAASSTTATVSRGEEEVDGGSPARSHASGAVWYHAATPEDYEGVIAAIDAAERESMNVSDGAVVWQQDTNEHWTYVDGATPTWQRNNTYHQFIYNSSGDQAGNRFNTWEDMFQAIDREEGLRIILFEQDETIPAGSWDLDNVELRGNLKEYNSGGYTLTFGDNTTISSWENPRVNSLRLLSTSTTGPVWSPVGPVTFTMSNLAHVHSTTNPFISHSGAGPAIISLNDSARWTLLPGGVENLETTMAAFQQLIIFRGDNSVVDDDTFASTNGVLFLDLIGSVTGDPVNYPSTHTNMTVGLAIALNLTFASALGFDPTGLAVVTGDTAQEAIEELDAGISGHINDTTDAHDASAISFDNTGLSLITADDVQEAIEWVDTTISSAGVLASGTYTPTLTTTANVSSSSVQDCRYIRMGSQVFVSGRVSITPTSSGVATRWRITLPVASNIGADNDLAGSGAGDQTDESAVNIRGDSTNDAAQFECAPTSTAQHLYAFTFGYTVI